MISEKQLPELKIYRELENLLPVESRPELAQLVVPADNDQLPVHRWFKFKEGYSAGLLNTLISSLGRNAHGKICILDPYCGSGTTLVSAQELSRSETVSAIGIERNPFIHFVASTKTRWPLMDSNAILALGEKCLASSKSLTGEIPRHTSFTTARCMSRHNTMRLVSIRDAIRADGGSVNHDALMLGLGAVVEQLSKTRKDGRALRLVEKERQDIGQVLSDKWNQIASDVRSMQQVFPHAPVPSVFLGDGRAPADIGIAPGSVDLIVTSPPYPNNIDYSEVYKLELWLLGFMKNSEDFLKLRKTTFRSHPNAALVDADDRFHAELKIGTLRAILEPIIDRTESSDEYHRHRVIVGYAADLWSALRAHYQLLKRGAHCVVVVGNSLHGGKHVPYLIPSDLLVSVIAQRIGYKVDNIGIARNFRRRLSGNHFLRESVIVLEKE